VGRQLRFRAALTEFVLVNLGLVIVAIGIVLFKAPNGFAMGGVSGLSIVISKYFPGVNLGIIALIIKERDLNKTTTLIVTHRYQDGSLLANFRYNRDNGELEPARGRDIHTVFMVMREGRVVFEGSQDELESNHDPYISNFYRQREHDA
jgi:hypothetical protein